MASTKLLMSMECLSNDLKNETSFVDQSGERLIALKLAS